MARAIRRDPCPKCGDADYDGDNLTTHADGSVNCYACSHHPPNVDVTNLTASSSARVTRLQTNIPCPDLLVPGAYAPLIKHGIKKETCERFGIFVSEYEGMIGGTHYKGPVVVFPHYKNGVLVKQKIKTPDKRMKWIGSGDTDMFLFNTYGALNKKLFITEGEEDALGVAQTVGMGPFQYTSLINGSSSAEKFVDENFEVLSRYEQIILIFDSDEPGQEAAQKFMKKFPYGKVANVILPLKDACDMLTANKDSDLKWAALKAETPRPKSSVTIDDLIDQVLIQPKSGQSWPFKSMTDITFGRRPGELYVIGGPSGCGKTELVKELIYDVLDKGENVGLCSLEQDVTDTVQRMVGSKLNKKLHLPGDWWDEDIIKETAMEYNKKLFLFDKNKGASNFETIVDTIYYWVTTKKCSFVILDNLSALCSDRRIDGKVVNEVEFMNNVVLRLSSLVKGQLSACTIMLITHVNKNTIAKSTYVSTSRGKDDDEPDLTPEEMDKKMYKPGLHYDSGRLPRAEEIKGGAHAENLADYFITLGRDRMSDDDTVRRTLMMRWCKCRKDSSLEGSITKLLYMPHTGRLEELIRLDIL